MKAIMPKIHLSRLKHLSTAFARKVDAAVSEAMEPYCESTENPAYLEFVDHTEEVEKEYYNGEPEMVKLPNGRFVFPNEYDFRRKFTVRDGKVFEKDAGPCKHEMRTKKAKKMTVVIRKFAKQFKTIKEFAEEYCGYRYYEELDKYGFYTNPDAFWDWYQIGGRWPGEFLVRADCPEYSLGERDGDVTIEAPEGYIWVSAARKKDIAWDAMRSWKREKDIKRFNTLEEAFQKGALPEGYWGRINENGILGFQEYMYIKGETVDEYLVRHHATATEKYPFRPYGFLSDTGWNTHEVYEYKDGKPTMSEKEKWEEELYAFMDNASDETVFVAVDNHN